MALCCQRRNSAVDEIGREFEIRKSSILCTKPTVYGSAITALMLAALGGLALAGLLFPGSPLNTLGNLIGFTGSYTTIGTGLALFALIVVARCCYNCRSKGEDIHRKVENLDLQHDLSLDELDGTSV